MLSLTETKAGAVDNNSMELKVLRPTALCVQDESSLQIVSWCYYFFPFGKIIEYRFSFLCFTSFVLIFEVNVSEFFLSILYIVFPILLAFFQVMHCKPAKKHLLSVKLEMLGMLWRCFFCIEFVGIVM